MHVNMSGGPPTRVEMKKERSTSRVSVPAAKSSDETSDGITHPADGRRHIQLN